MVPMETVSPALAAGAFVLVILLLSSLKIAQEYQRAVVFFLGRHVG